MLSAECKVQSLASICTQHFALCIIFYLPIDKVGNTCYITHRETR